MSQLVNDARKALSETTEFWQALSQTGDYKSDLVKSDERFAKFIKYHELCALCEYAKEYTEFFSTECSKCPVDWAVYPSLVRTEFLDSDIDYEQGTCQHISSPFRQWEIAETKEGRKKWAMEVANLAKRTLDNFLKEEKRNG